MAKELGLRERLVRYFQRNHTKWIASGELQRLVVQHTKHTPRSAVRRLQELHEEGVLDRELRKNHTFYRYAAPKTHHTTQCEACIANKESVRDFDRV